MKRFLLWMSATPLLAAVTCVPAAAQEAAAPAPAGEAAAGARSSAPLPSAASVIDRYIQITGGKAAYDAVTTQLSTGTLSIAAAGISGTIKEYAAAPSKSYAVMDIPGVGAIEGGTNGKIAWENSVLQGARILRGDEASTAMRKASSDVVTNWRKYYESAEVAGTETVEGKVCWKLVMKPAKGSPETDYYEKESGLLIRQSAVTDTPMGPVPSETILSDYRKQGDLLMPFHIEQRMAGQQFDIKLDKIELNASIPDSRFEPPAEIKALEK